MNVIYVETLADFVREVEVENARPVRLALSAQDEGNMPAYRRFTLTLGGINAYDELVLLHERITLLLDRHAAKPLTTGGQSITDQVSHWHNLVRDFLVAHGYSVRSGMYALPQSFTAMAGSFDEATRWRCTARSNGECEAWVVEAPSD